MIKSPEVFHQTTFDPSQAIGEAMESEKKYAYLIFYNEMKEDIVVVKEKILKESIISYTIGYPDTRIPNIGSVGVVVTLGKRVNLWKEYEEKERDNMFTTNPDHVDEIKSKIAMRQFRIEEADWERWRKSDDEEFVQRKAEKYTRVRNNLEEHML